MEQENAADLRKKDFPVPKTHATQHNTRKHFTSRFSFHLYRYDAIVMIPNQSRDTCLVMMQK